MSRLFSVVICVFFLVCGVSGLLCSTPTRHACSRWMKPMSLSSWDSIDQEIESGKRETRGNKNAPTNKLFLGNLPFTFTSEALATLAKERGLTGFSNGRIVVDKKTGKSRGFGYLDFADEEAAKAASSAMAGLEIEGRQVKIDVTYGVEGANKGRRKSPEFSVFIGNLDFSLTEQDVHEEIKSHMGPSAGKFRARVSLIDGRSKGYGHLDFETQEAADAAIAALTGYELRGRVITVEKAIGREAKKLREDDGQKQDINSKTPFFKKNSSNTIFIGNLPFKMDDDLIKEMIDDVVGAGKHRRVHLSVDKDTGLKKGFGHVDFDTPEIAAEAVEKLNGLEVYGRIIKADLASNSKSV